MNDAAERSVEGSGRLGVWNPLLKSLEGLFGKPITWD
jgi:hypothetical protein